MDLFIVVVVLGSRFAILVPLPNLPLLTLAIFLCISVTCDLRPPLRFVTTGLFLLLLLPFKPPRFSCGRLSVAAPRRLRRGTFLDFLVLAIAFDR